MTETKSSETSGGCMIIAGLILVLSIVTGGFFDTLVGNEEGDASKMVFIFFWIFVATVIFYLVKKNRSKKQELS